MKLFLNLVVFIVFPLLFLSCKNENLETVTTQKEDHYNIILLSDNGYINEGEGKFYIEFQNADNDQPVEVGNLKVQANMPMPGRPMVNDATVTTTDKKGRYMVKYNMSMAGSWILNVRYDNNIASIPIAVQ